MTISYSYINQLLKFLEKVFEKNRTHIPLLVSALITSIIIIILQHIMYFVHVYMILTRPCFLAVYFVFLNLYLGGIFGALSIGKTTKNLIEAITKSLIIGIVYSSLIIIIVKTLEGYMILSTYIIILSVIGGVTRYSLRRLQPT